MVLCQRECFIDTNLGGTDSILIAKGIPPVQRPGAFNHWPHEERLAKEIMIYRGRFLSELFLMRLGIPPINCFDKVSRFDCLFLIKPFEGCIAMTTCTVWSLQSFILRCRTTQWQFEKITLPALFFSITWSDTESVVKVSPPPPRVGGGGGSIIASVTGHTCLCYGCCSCLQIFLHLKYK